jgi:hypothetical protein
LATRARLLAGTGGSQPFGLVQTVERRLRPVAALLANGRRCRVQAVFEGSEDDGGVCGVRNVSKSLDHTNKHLK